jgi:hypothetical protein
LGVVEHWVPFATAVEAAALHVNTPARPENPNGIGGCSSNQTGTKDVIKCEDSEPALFEAPGILNEIFFSANLGTQREDRIQRDRIR